MRNLIIVLAVAFSFSNSYAQKILSLKECHQLATQNYPLLKQKVLIKEFEQEQLELLKHNYLPQFNLLLNASYQSDVSSLSSAGSLPISLPDISKDQYRANLDIKQLIWDGGINESRKSIIKLDQQIQDQEVEISLYQVKDKINQLFFSYILLDKQIKVLGLNTESIQAQADDLKLLIDEGMALQSDLDILKAEIINLNQKTTDLKFSQNGIRSMLSVYLGKEISANTKFESLNETISLNLNNNRLELKSFELSQSRLNTSKSLIDTYNKPKLYANGQLGYGRPGLNMLSNDFDSYYKIGISLNWKLWDWNKKKTEKKMLDIQSGLVQKQRETFEHNVKVSQQKINEEIKKFRAFITQDKDLIKLRRNIVKVSESRLKNGTITSAEYITELNKKIQAELNYEYHNVQLSLANQNLKYLLGHD